MSSHSACGSVGNNWSRMAALGMALFQVITSCAGWPGGGRALRESKRAMQSLLWSRLRIGTLSLLPHSISTKHS